MNNITPSIEYCTHESFGLIYLSTVYNNQCTNQIWKQLKGLDSEKVKAEIRNLKDKAILASATSDKGICVFFEDDGKYFVIDLNGSELMIRQYSSEFNTEPSKLFLEIIEKLDIKPEKKSDKFTITFTSYDSSRNYVSYNTKQLDGSKLDDILINYGSEVQTFIQKIRNIKKIKNNGKLIILNGKPGTGKTHLLRALFREWNKGISAYYITDPENLLKNPEYLNQMLNDDKKAIILMEDCDFFISKQSKTEYTQSASRLLNTLDGILGQGMDFIFILTANEDMKNIHEAFSRKGRCLANIPFEGLTYDEAKIWCEKHNVRIEDVSSTGTVGFNKNTTKSFYTLADLYDLIPEDENFEEFSEISDDLEDDDDFLDRN